MPPTNETHLSYNSTAPEEVIAGIIDTQLISCENEDRIIPFIRLAEYQSLEGRTIDYSGRFSDAYVDITTIATANNIGWYADIQPIEGNEQYAEIVFYIYNGLDRSISQSTNSRLELSYENDSLASTYFEANKGIPTTALVAGQGEGVDRSVELINGTVSGLARNEIFIDARDIEDDLLLPQRGQEKLAEYGDNSNYQITFNQLLIERYRKDFDLGDIGTVTDTIAGSVTDVRLTEITEVYEQGEYRIDVTFGYDKQSLGEAVKKSVSTVSNAEALIKTEGGGSGGDAETLGGYLPEDFALTEDLNIYLPLTGTAADSLKLGGVAASSYALKADYLPVNGVAADSIKLNGVAASGYSLAGHTHSYLPLAGGTLTGSLGFSANGVSSSIFSANSSYIHYTTNAPYGHWFNTTVRVAGEIYAGASYNQKVWHGGDFYLQSS